MLDCKPTKGASLPGTDTALIGLFIDGNGYPQSSSKSVRVYPGQKIIFAGPNQFDIFFKEQKSPINQIEIKSINGIVAIEIPIDIFERDQRTSKATGASDKRELIYSYGIRANGKVTDPEIIVAKR